MTEPFGTINPGYEIVFLNSLKLVVCGLASIAAKSDLLVWSPTYSNIF